MTGPIITGTPPQIWSGLLQALSEMGTDVATLGEQGITTFGQLQTWLNSQGYELVEISEVTGYTIAKVSGVDPANTTDVATRVVTDIATTGGAGTAVSTITSGGNRTLGLVTKLVAVSACLSLLVSTIGAGLVTDEVKEDLITSADPYTIDGENVPVLIDSNGKTHFPADLVEAIRAKAVELGVFSTGSDIDTIETKPQAFTNVTLPLGRAHDFSTIVLEGVTYYYDPNTYEERGGVRPGKTYIGFPVKPDYITSFTGRDGSQSRTLGAYSSTPATNKLCAFNVYDDGTVEVRALNTPTVYSYTYNNQTVYYEIYTMAIPSGRTFNSISANQNTLVTTTYDQIAWLLEYGDVIPAPPGVPGIEPNPNTAADMNDLTKPVTEIIPQLDIGKMTIASPTDDDLENKSDWYPASINTEDVFEDGATEDDTSTAPDGDVKPELEPQIIDAIKDLIQDLISDPDHPDDITYPEIEVGDSGDTPPENPPLEPPSDVTGSNGLWSIYNPSLQQVNDFGAWLWSDTLADQFKRIFNSPIDGVIGFHMLYCTPTTGTSKTIKCGFLSSPVSAPTVSDPYVEIDCGSVTIGEYYRNALDYDNTRISVYLPFVGIVPLDTNVVMSSSLAITYRVDVLTGTCLAQIKVVKQNSSAVMYSFAGNCAVQVPLTATTYTGVVGALLNGISAGASIMTGNLVQAAGSAVGALANGFSGLSGAKQSGTFGANAGALGIRIPYVIITHPVSAMPYAFNEVEGLPSNRTVRLSSMSGFTRVRSVHLENVGTATEEEINMIKELLMEGVII